MKTVLKKHNKATIQIAWETILENVQNFKNDEEIKMAPCISLLSRLTVGGGIHNKWSNIDWYTTLIVANQSTQVVIYCSDWSTLCSGMIILWSVENNVQVLYWGWEVYKLGVLNISVFKLALFHIYHVIINSHLILSAIIN